MMAIVTKDSILVDVIGVFSLCIVAVCLYINYVIFFFLDHSEFINMLNVFKFCFRIQPIIHPILCVCILVMLISELNSAETPIDEFVDDSLQDWRFFSDSVMGGVSQGSIEHINTTAFSGLRLSGLVSTKNNGGFIQVRRAVDFSSLSHVEGIKFLARGNGEEYQMHIRTRALLPWQYYSVSFTAPEKWAEIQLPFTAFTRSSRWLSSKLKKDRIRTIAIVAFGKPFEADCTIRELSTY